MLQRAPIYNLTNYNNNNFVCYFPQAQDDAPVTTAVNVYYLIDGELTEKLLLSQSASQLGFQVTQTVSHIN
jgi:hypothetical protein